MVFAAPGVSPAAAAAALRVVVALAGAALVAAALFAAGAAFAGAALAGAVLAGAAFVAAALAGAAFVVARAAVLAAVPVVARLEATVFLAVLVAAATPALAESMATVMPCSPRARSTMRPRAARTSAARMASATSAPVSEPVVEPFRTRDCKALWENSGGSALVSEGLLDTGDTDYLSSRMATFRGRASGRPEAAGKVLCDTVSKGRGMLGRGGDEVRITIIKREGPIEHIPPPKRHPRGAGGAAWHSPAGGRCTVSPATSGAVSP